MEKGEKNCSVPQYEGICFTVPLCDFLFLDGVLCRYEEIQANEVIVGIGQHLQNRTGGGGGCEDALNVTQDRIKV